MDHFGWYRSWWVTVLKVRLGYHFCIIRSWRVTILKVRPHCHFCINNPASLVITRGIVHGSVHAMGTENVLSSSSSFALCHADSTSTFKTGLLKGSSLSQLIIVFIPTVHGRWMGGRVDACMSECLVLLLLSCAICGWCVSETDPRWSVGACMTVRACPLIFGIAICGCCISETDLWSWNWWYGWGGGGGEGGATEQCVSSGLHKTDIAWCHSWCC